jgi:thiamine-monophosphate kinase
VKISKLGEFGLIERLARIVQPSDADDVIVGIGDDAAVWHSGDRFVIATTDTMADGVHFLSKNADWHAIGWKAFATNASDIAAMGGRPEYALVTLCLPPDTDVANLDALYEGLRECADACAARVVGGDIVRSPVMTITVAVFGRAGEQHGEPLLLRRNSARVGNRIAVTGTLGDSAGGLRKLQEADESHPLVTRHLRPEPRIAHGTAAAGAGVRCGIDVSDGLLQDVGHVCEASGVGALVRADDIPLSNDLRAAFPDDVLELACTGGEDYELILVGDVELLARLDPPVTIIGEIVGDPERRVRLLDAAGNEINYERQGWDAFR